MLEPYLQPGDGVLDIGAHVGHYAIKYARHVGPTGQVLAIEPDPVTCEQARKAGAGLKNLTFMSVACSDVIGPPRTVYRDRGDARRHSLWAANVIEAGDTFEVRTVTLDFAASLVPTLAAIKIDTQGAERLVLAGATETLARPGITWAIELWPEGLRHAGSSLGDVIGMLAAAGLVAVDGRSWEAWEAALATLTGHKAVDVVCRRAM